jgi:hypothetical protein
MTLPNQCCKLLNCFTKYIQFCYHDTFYSWLYDCTNVVLLIPMIMEISDLSLKKIQNRCLLSSTDRFSVDTTKMFS